MSNNASVLCQKNFRKFAETFKESLVNPGWEEECF